MNWSSDDSRDITLADLTDFDIGRRVRFKRAPNGHGRPIIHGKLLGFSETKYQRGNMLKTGMMVYVGFESRWGGFNQDSFGPFPLSWPIWVGKPWVRRTPDPDWFDDTP